MTQLVDETGLLVVARDAVGQAAAHRRHPRHPSLGGPGDRQGGAQASTGRGRPQVREKVQYK